MALPDINGAFASHKDFIFKERKEVIQKLAMLSGREKKVPDATKEPLLSLVPRLDALLAWLEQVRITPQYKETKIDEGLKLMYDDPKYFFSDAHREKAKQILEKWNDENWGGPPPAENSMETNSDEDEESEDAETGAEDSTTRRKTTTTGTKSKSEIKPVPKNHPIFGEHGIMHGVGLRLGSRKTYVLNPAYKKRKAKVYGHNGLAVGTWFPKQLVALFRGAHGTSQGGICGDPTTGAYSIVVASAYDTLDHDSGEFLNYSGSGSHKNDDPRNIPQATTGTRSLHASLRTGNPVQSHSLIDRKKSMGANGGHEVRWVVQCHLCHYAKERQWRTL